MGSASFVVRARSSAAPERLFALLADAPAWAEWAGPLVPQARWEPGTPAGVGGVRRVGAGPLSVREKVVRHEAPSVFSYVLLSGVRWHGYRADVHLLPDAGTTVVEWNGRVSTPVPRAEHLLLPPFRRAVEDFTKRLVHAAER